MVYRSAEILYQTNSAFSDRDFRAMGQPALSGLTIMVMVVTTFLLLRGTKRKEKDESSTNYESPCRKFLTVFSTQILIGWSAFREHAHSEFTADLLRKSSLFHGKLIQWLKQSDYKWEIWRCPNLWVSPDPSHMRRGLTPYNQWNTGLSKYLAFFILTGIATNKELESNPSVWSNFHSFNRLSRQRELDLSVPKHFFKPKIKPKIKSWLRLRSQGR